MKINCRFILIICCLPVLAASFFAQTPNKIEQELVAGIEQVQKYSDYRSNYDQEKLSNANELFEKNMLKYTKIASTLNYKFPALGKKIFIATSDDGKFRIYSWDTEDGGTMHNFARVYQYLGSDGKVYSKTEENAEEGDMGSFVYDIFTVDAKGGKIYIVCSTFIGSTNDHYGSADLFKIEGGAIKDKVKMFKTKSGLTDAINFEYNFFSVADRKERPIRLILFDKNTKTIKIPVVIETKDFPNGKVTSKFIDYRFDGNYFVRTN